jgi:RNA-directed DNA polymerase
MGFLRRLLSRPDTGRGVDELGRRLGLTVEELLAVPITYREFAIPKRSGGSRTISAPDGPLKGLQRRIRRRLLARLECHPAATGFERGKSIVTNARPHAGKAVVVHMDIKDFFPSTSVERIRRHFRGLGWNREATELLLRLCTHRGGLPQGAPTSPRLSNLVNWRLDARLSGLAAKFGATYTRYADDITFSFDADEPTVIHALIGVTKPTTVHAVIGMTKHIVAREGYALHQRRKLHIRRRHNQQLVTGLVVNERVALPRRTRRWLRSVEHHAARGLPTTLTPAQLAGWRALRAMVAKQSAAGPDRG